MTSDPVTPAPAGSSPPAAETQRDADARRRRTATPLTSHDAAE